MNINTRSQNTKRNITIGKMIREDRSLRTKIDNLVISWFNMYFGTYCDYKEACDDYWRHQEEMEREEREYRLQELNELLVEL